MRRSASEVIRSLEMRIARLEGKTAFADIKLTRSAKKEIEEELGSMAKVTRVSSEDVNRKSNGQVIHLVRVEYKDAMTKRLHASYAVVSQEGRDQYVYGVYDSSSSAMDENRSQFR